MSKLAVHDGIVVRRRSSQFSRVRKFHSHFIPKRAVHRFGKCCGGLSLWATFEANKRPPNIKRGDGQVNQIELAVNDYLEWLRAHGYAELTVRARRYYLAGLVEFLTHREVTDLGQVTPNLLDAYQHQLFSHRKADGSPLSFCTQAQRLVPVKGLFDWLSRTDAVISNPATSLTLPKTEDRIPAAVLSVDEVEAVLAQPDTSTALGLRDRAILEVFYSTAIRRSELIRLFVADVDHARASLFLVRRGSDEPVWKWCDRLGVTNDGFWSG
jgi:site-specific recombinase XerC